MKRFLVAVFAVFALSPAAYSADDSLMTSPRAELAFARAIISQQMASLSAEAKFGNLINWKIGDTASYDVALEMLPMPIGTMTKTVDRDEDDTLWMVQNLEIPLLGQSMVSEVQIDRKTGKILKMVVNGQEQQVPDEQPEIVSQEAVEITVPAGTFQAIHLVVNTSQVQGVELWVNPIELVMDGMIKQLVPMMGMPIKFELTSFEHGQ